MSGSGEHGPSRPPPQNSDEPTAPSERTYEESGVEADSRDIASTEMMDIVDDRGGHEDDEDSDEDEGDDGDLLEDDESWMSQPIVAPQQGLRVETPAATTDNVAADASTVSTIQQPVQSYSQGTASSSQISVIAPFIPARININDHVALEAEWERRKQYLKQRERLQMQQRQEQRQRQQQEQKQERRQQLRQQRQQHREAFWSLQNRLPNDVLQFVRQTFYQDVEMTNHPDTEVESHPQRQVARAVAAHYGALREDKTGAVFLGIDAYRGIAVQESSGTSLINGAEAKYGVEVARKLIAQGAPPSDICFVVFYGAQAREIRKRLAGFGEDQIDIRTVDQAYDMTAAHVIVSLVATANQPLINTYVSYGSEALFPDRFSSYVKDRNRLHVALTRCKHSLIVLLNGPSIAHMKMPHYEDVKCGDSTGVELQWLLRTLAQAKLLVHGQHFDDNTARTENMSDEAEQTLKKRIVDMDTGSLHLGRYMNAVDVRHKEKRKIKEKVSVLV